jgi:polyisoprenoid-binding protein YceI
MAVSVDDCGMKSFLQAGVVMLAVVSAFGRLSGAQQTTIVLEPEKTTVSFILQATLHTVHGTFRLKSGVVRFDPATGAASGAIVADATSGQTGNKRRDRNMHQDVLESGRYPEITFTPTRVTGSLIAQGESSVALEGVLHLKGADHAISLPVNVQTSASEIKATTQFAVPYVAWGLKDPSTFFLRVADKVDVNIVATGRLTSAVPQH